MTVEDKTYFQEFFKKLIRVGISEKKTKEDTPKVRKYYRLHDITTLCSLMNFAVSNLGNIDKDIFVINLQ